ncbi:hypothetical protein HPP92_021254 [Vanilla planifolia]|uniref:Uncharacterized protein n=1 Tax=Vanilla planifolia TaxID=51239 RepID=A0A835UGM5_VANPL|nr:hypothetical protein HPP92_021254 [Vanilla planifolia]
MCGSFLRRGGFRACEIIRRCRIPIASGATGSSAQRLRAFVKSIPVASKFARHSTSHFSPAASALVPSSAAASSAVPMKGLVRWYLRMIEKRPVLTKSVTAGAIFAAADMSSQMIMHSVSDSIDLMRTLRMASFGILISGPSLHVWYNFISRVLPKRDAINILKKIFIGQAIFGPIVNVCFFSMNAALQGETEEEILARLRRDLIPTLKSSLAYWPACDFITFKFVTVRLQPLVNNSFAFLWTIYLTYVASLQKAADYQVAVN